jgi:hypothetical protein
VVRYRMRLEINKWSPQSYPKAVGWWQLFPLHRPSASLGGAMGRHLRVKVDK